MIWILGIVLCLLGAWLSREVSIDSWNGHIWVISCLIFLLAALGSAFTLLIRTAAVGFWI